MLNSIINNDFVAWLKNFDVAVNRVDILYSELQSLLMLLSL